MVQIKPRINFVCPSVISVKEWRKINSCFSFVFLFFIPSSSKPCCSRACANLEFLVCKTHNLRWILFFGVCNIAWYFLRYIPSGPMATSLIPSSLKNLNAAPLFSSFCARILGFLFTRPTFFDEICSSKAQINTPSSKSVSRLLILSIRSTRWLLHHFVKVWRMISKWWRGGSGKAKYYYHNFRDMWTVISVRICAVISYFMWLFCNFSIRRIICLYYLLLFWEIRFDIIRQLFHFYCWSKSRWSFYDDIIRKSIIIHTRFWISIHPEFTGAPHASVSPMLITEKISWKQLGGAENK